MTLKYRALMVAASVGAATGHVAGPTTKPFCGAT